MTWYHIFFYISLITNDIDCLSRGFSCAYIFSGKVLVQILYTVFIRHFVFSILSCKSSSSILNTGPLSDICRENIFSQTVICLFISLAVSFKEQVLLILIKSNFSNFFLMIHTLYVLGKKKIKNKKSAESKAEKISYYFLFLPEV